MIDDLLEQARKKGSDKDFREWVQRQPSCLSGRFSEWLPDIGEWRNPACHVRRAGRSGTAFKEPFACIPLTKTEHDFQHQHGERALLMSFSIMLPPVLVKEWYDNKRVEYLKRWLES